MGRGSFDYRTDQNSGLHLIKWWDNKGVLLGSSFNGVEATDTITRWDSTAKGYIDVAYPDMVKAYNENMGGVDTNDMLISSYRADFHVKKRWYVKIISHCINICNVKSWLLYRRYMDQLTILPKN